MTSHLILNVGLLTGGAEIADTCVLKAMRAAGVLWETYRRHEWVQEDDVLLVSKIEPTLVVEVFANDHQIDLVSTWLEQDCIAVWDMIHWEGRLVGPKAAEWGEFDPTSFLLLNGSLLSEARRVA